MSVLIQQQRANAAGGLLSAVLENNYIPTIVNVLVSGAIVYNYKHIQYPEKLFSFESTTLIMIALIIVCTVVSLSLFTYGKIKHDRAAERKGHIVSYVPFIIYIILIMLVLIMMATKK